jgi:hypothetical protein
MTIENSRNPANSGSLTGTLREILSKFLSDVDDMLPARVVAYDRDTNRAQVKPLIGLLLTDETVVDRATLASVPVFNIGSGSALLHFNIRPNDLGWIKANDRDISLYLDSLKESQPNTLRKHDFADSIFIPDHVREFNITDEDALVSLQNTEGSQKVEIFDDKIVVTTPDSLDVIGRTNLGNSDGSGDLKPIAREGDTVQVTLPAGTFNVNGDGSSPNKAVTLNGNIISGSPNNTSN